MKSGALFRIGRLTLFLGLLALSTTNSFGQSVSGFILAKIQNFRQTSSSAPVVDAVQPFQFGSLLTPGTATINSATLTFNGSASPRSYTDTGFGLFEILDTFMTQSAMDAAYQTGNYNLSINSSVGDLSTSIFLLPLSYPVTPPLTVPAGDWQSGAIVIDPTQDYTITWGPFSNANPVDLIQFAVRGSIVIPAPLPATTTSYTITAGSLLPNTDYTCDLAFARVAGANAGGTDIGPGYATFAKDTGFMIHTTAGGSATPSPTPPPNPTPTATPTTTPPEVSPTPTIPPTTTPTGTASTPPGGTPTPSPTPTPTQTPNPSPTPTPEPTASPTPSAGSALALNISTRMRVDTGNNVLIGGFIVTDSASKEVAPEASSLGHGPQGRGYNAGDGASGPPKDIAVRGIGPSLGAFGVPDALADPTLELRDSSNAVIRANDDWQDDSAQAALLTKLDLALSDAKESGMVATLQPGAYTAVLEGKNDGTGVGLMEIYDTSPTSASQLSNISTRGLVLTGSNVMIGGFILGGSSGNTHVAVRGIGPSLADLGLSPVLMDPTLELHDGDGNTLATNNDWLADPPTASELIAVGLGLSNEKESGIYTLLPPGAYTAVLTGTDGGTGIGLVEIYNVH